MTGGTATAGADYAAFAADALSWPVGDTTAREVPIAILDDTVREGDETIVVALSSPSAGAPP